MTATQTLTANAAYAFARASAGHPVVPLCWPGENSACTFPVCPGKWDATSKRHVTHEARDVGKAPLGKLVPDGWMSASADVETVVEWWARYPDANVGEPLEPNGWLVVDPDSDHAQAEAHKLGLSPTLTRHSKNTAFVYTRPSDCPPVNLTKRGDSGQLDILATGYVVTFGTHRDGHQVRLDNSAITSAPAWAVAWLTRETAQREAAKQRSAERATGDTEPPVRLHPRGLQRWRGELVQTTDGRTDTSDSLFYIGLDLAECNATRSAVVAALAARDVALGWRKYTDRADADERYGEIADKAIAREDARRQGSPSDLLTWPTLEVGPLAAGPANGECSPHCAKHHEIIEAQRTVIANERAERERLGRLVNARAAIDRNPDLTPADKLVIPHALGLVYHRKERDAEHAPRQVVYLQAVRARTGLSEKTVSKCLEKVPEIGKQLEHNKAKDGRIITILADLPSEAHAIMAASNHHPALPRNQGGRTDRPRYRGCPNGCTVPLSVQPLTTVTCTGCGAVTDELPGKRSQIAASESKSQLGIYSDAPPDPDVSDISMTRKDGIYSDAADAATPKSQLGIYPDGATREALDDLVRRHRAAPQPPAPDADVGFDQPSDGMHSPWLLQFLTLGSAGRWQSQVLCGILVRQGQKHWEGFAREHPDRLPRVVGELRQLRESAAGMTL